MHGGRTSAECIYTSRVLLTHAMIVIHATFPIDPDHRSRAREIIQELAESSRAEDGIIDYRVTTDVESPNEFRFFEQYEDESAFEVHSQTDHFRRFEEALPDLLAGEPEVIRFEVDAVTELDL